MKYSKQIASEWKRSDNRFYKKNQHKTENLYNELHKNSPFQLHSVRGFINSSHLALSLTIHICGFGKEKHKSAIFIQGHVPTEIIFSCHDDASRVSIHTKENRSLPLAFRLPYLKLNYVSRAINHPATPLLGSL